MKYITITDAGRLDLLLDISIGEHLFDLHNDFGVVNIKQTDGEIAVIFKRLIQEKGSIEENGLLLFSSVIASNLAEVISSGSLGNLETIIDFSRGDLTPASKFYGQSDIRYFFLEFEEGESIDIFCKSAIIFFW